MNILFINEKKQLIGELGQYISKLDAKAFFAADAAEISEILVNTHIDIVIIPIKELSNISMLKFVGDTFKKTRIVITTDNCDNKQSSQAINLGVLKKQLIQFKYEKVSLMGLNICPN